MLFLEDLAKHDFLQYALLGGLLASIACGLLGPFVVVRRIGYVAGGIAHSLLWGLGLALVWGHSPLLGATIAALLGALLIGWVTQHWREQEDTVISALWSIGMAGGVLLIAHSPGYQTDLMSYLFGNILMVTPSDIKLMVILDFFLFFLMMLFYRQFLALSFDEEFARLRGLPTMALYLLLLCMIALTIVLVMQVVGMILLIALLTLPAAIAAQHVGNLSRMMMLASALGVLFSLLGLSVSYQLDYPTGATIILLTGIAYLVSTTYHSLRMRLTKA
jgi:zinc transport system permease protein